MSIAARKNPNQLLPYFPIRINSVALGVPLTFDIYLMVADKPVLFRRRNEVITAERMKALVLHGGEQFLIPDEQRAAYLQSLRMIIRDPNSTTEMKSRFIKESAFVHVQDLFTKENVSEAVGEAHTLIEEMVTFVSTDVEAVSTLMRLSKHDYYTYNHCVDVAVYAIALAKRIYGDDKKLLFVAGLGGLLHDIGKRKLDLTLINKNSPLTPSEWEEIKRHPSYGKEILAEVGSLPDESRLIVFEHHENYDGTGYPRGLKGEDISNLARIVTIADVFDALTTDRSYHKAIPPTEALNTMFAMQPGKFDPNIFRSFNKNFALKSRFTLPKNFDPCQPANKIIK